MAKPSAAAPMARVDPGCPEITGGGWGIERQAPTFGAQPQHLTVPTVGARQGKQAAAHPRMLQHK